MNDLFISNLCKREGGRKEKRRVNLYEKRKEDKGAGEGGVVPRGMGVVDVGVLSKGCHRRLREGRRKVLGLGDGRSKFHQGYYGIFIE